MKGALLLGAALMVLCAAAAQVQAQEPPPRFFIVHFETGPGWDASLVPQQQKQFREHSDNLNRLRKEGVIAFGARYEQYGVIVLRAQSMEAANELLAADPGVQAGTFVFRIAPLDVFYPWK